MRRTSRPSAFTFVELLVASSVSTVFMAGLMTGAITLQRGYSAARYQVECQEDQLRVMDCIVRDLRRAASVTISNQNRKLSLTLPDQLDASGALRTPAIVNGEVQYGSAPSTVAYLVNGTAFVRQEGSTQTVLSTNPAGLEGFYVYNDNPALTPSQLRLTICFVPSFSRRGGVNAGAATRTTTVVRLRNTADVLVQ